MQETSALFIFTFLFFFQGSYSMEKDSNVVVRESRELHEFVWQKAKNTVEVKQTITDTYQCNYFPTTLLVTEPCYDQMSIDKIDVTCNNKKVRDIKPQYTFYNPEGIFFSNDRICFFHLPIESKGNTGTVSFRKTIQDPRYFSQIYFSGPWAVTYKEVCVKVPRWMKVELKEINCKDFDITRTTVYDKEEDADLYTYTIKNIPAIFSEPNCPGITYTQPHLLVLAKEATIGRNRKVFINTIADQYAWYRQLAGNIGSNDSLVSAMALHLTAGLSGDLDKIKAIFYWVQRNIRYIAFENGSAAFKPDKADEVMRKKYGDCKGMANLTKELLKSIGFDTRLCWIGTNNIAYDYSTPSIAVDNHMICALFWNGSLYFLDATQTYLSFPEHAERIQGRPCLIENGDNYILARIPSSSYRQNLDKKSSSIYLQGTAIQGTVTHLWKGEEKEMILFNLNSIRKDMSAEAFKSYLSRRNPGRVITGLEISDANNLDQEFTASYNFRDEEAVFASGGDYYVNLDFDKEFSNFIFDTAKRKLDYWFSHKLHVIRETELTIPEGYTLKGRLPNLEISNDHYQFHITCMLIAGKIVYKKEMVVNDPKLLRSMFAQWNTDIQKLTASYKEQIVLTAKNKQ